MFSCRDMVYNPVAWPVSVVQSLFFSLMQPGFCSLMYFLNLLITLESRDWSSVDHYPLKTVEVGRWVEGRHSGWCHEKYREKMAFP